MKYLLLILTVLIFTGCGTESTTSTSNQSSIAIKSKAHGYAENYSADRLESLKKSGNKFAVFAGASWCPGCKRLAEQITSNQQILPKNTAILIADFDTELELRRTYGVTVKHTGIFFEADGSHQKTVSGVLMSDFMAHLSNSPNSNSR